MVVEQLSDKREIHISMDGTKISKENDEEHKGWDFKIHISSDDKPINYIDDFFVDIIRKREINPDIVEPLLNALKESIELVHIDEIYAKHAELASKAAPDIDVGTELTGEIVQFVLEDVPQIQIPIKELKRSEEA